MPGLTLLDTTPGPSRHSHSNSDPASLMSSPPRPSMNPSLKRHKESTFIDKRGHRHHSFDPEKAPYPVSYDRDVIELQSLDRAMISHLKHSVSFVDFKDEKPENSLDLGCGVGMWVVDAAKEWPECHFVGFDLVNIQIPLALLDKSIAERIKWVHGNFLTTKLPFEDDEFDHVHIDSIARGVPEHKWNVLFEEVNRVLRPGGVVEISEHDIIFPTLPRWFTAPLRVRSRRADSIHLPDGPRPRIPSPVPTPIGDQPPHDHALLEELFKSVFESRFISLKPTVVLPIYFTPYFRQVLSSPVINFPMPPLAPLPPLPEQIIPPDPLTAQFESSDPTAYSSPHEGSQSPPFTRPTSLSISSTLSSTTSNSTEVSTAESIFTSSNEATSSSSASMSDSREFPTSSEVTLSPSDPTPEKENGKGKKESCHHRFMTGNSASDSTSIGFSPAQLLLPVEEMTKFNERALAMHLYHSYQSVLACKESMWDELQDRIFNRKEELNAFGWEDDEELEQMVSRTKFDKLVERYKTDMQARVSLWCSLSDLGWPLPPREPLSKAELIEEERIHQAMMESRRYATDEDFQQLCRSMRVIVGFKGSS